MSVFEKASKKKLRFNTNKGELCADQLWDLPLESKVGALNLDDIARGLFKQLKNDDSVSFVNKENKSDELVQLRFDVVKHIIEVRLAENQAKSQARSNSEKKQQLMEILVQRENEVLKEKSPEEIKAMIASIGD